LHNKSASPSVVATRDNLMAHYGAGHDDATAAANYALWRRNNGVHKSRRVYRCAPSTALATVSPHEDGTPERVARWVPGLRWR